MPSSSFFSVIGAVIIVAGLYALIWGKSKDVIGADVSTGGSKGASTQLPVTSAAPNGNGKLVVELGNGNGRHENGHGRGHVLDVEMPVANGHY